MTQEAAHKPTGKNFNDQDLARRYPDGPPRFVPGYEAMQQVSAQLLHERAGDDGLILVLGAGGGLELEAFALAYPNWRLTGVDPAPAMLNAARERVEAAGVSDRITLVPGYIEDAPQVQFDGAVCLLTLHFVKDDGSKLNTLRELRQRLKLGAAFAVVDLCVDLDAEDADLRLDRFSTFAINAAVDREAALQTRSQVRNRIAAVSPARQTQLLIDAGFKGVEPFYQGLSWLGLVGYA